MVEAVSTVPAGDAGEGYTQCDEAMGSDMNIQVSVKRRARLFQPTPSTRLQCFTEETISYRNNVNFCGYIFDVFSKHNTV